MFLRNISETNRTCLLDAAFRLRASVRSVSWLCTPCNQQQTPFASTSYLTVLKISQILGIQWKKYETQWAALKRKWGALVSISHSVAFVKFWFSLRTLEILITQITDCG